MPPTPNLLKYSNGWGHVIMSVASMAVAVILLLVEAGNTSIQGLAIGMIVTVQGYWFVTSSANTISRQVGAALAAPTQPLAQPPTTVTTGGNTNGVA